MVERADLEHWQRLVDEELGAAAAPGAESPDGTRYGASPLFWGAARDFLARHV